MVVNWNPSEYKCLLKFSMWRGHISLCPGGSPLHPWHTAGDISLARHYFVFYGLCLKRPLNSDYFYNTYFTFFPSPCSMVLVSAVFGYMPPLTTPTFCGAPHAGVNSFLRLCPIQENPQPHGPKLRPNTTLAHVRWHSQKSQYSLTGKVHWEKFEVDWHETDLF